MSENLVMMFFGIVATAIPSLIPKEVSRATMFYLWMDVQFHFHFYSIDLEFGRMKNALSIMAGGLSSQPCEQAC